MAIFRPKPWVNCFGKMSIFRVFVLLVFLAQKGVFSFQNIVKDIFLAYIASKKKLKKWPFLDQNQGLTPLEKFNLSTFLACYFYSLERRFSVLEYCKGLFPSLYCIKKKIRKTQPRKAFFCSRISPKTFSLPVFPKKESWKNGHFWTKTMG